jgi:ATP-dependent Clp protease ATP-binding subunit ClpA
MQMFELSTKAEELYKRAAAISTNLNHQYVEPEHFLVALAVQGGPASRILASYGMTNETIRPVVKSMHPFYETPKGKDRIEQLTKVTTRILNVATMIAQAYKTGSLVTPEFILAILIHSKDENVLHVFDELDVNAEDVGVDTVQYIFSLSSAN